VPDPRTDRITELAEALHALPPLEPRPVRLARRAVAAAQADLAAVVAHGSDARIVDAMRYRVERARDLVDERWRQALHA
jgi:hypothetical protein